MPGKFSILALDFHNTVYDEVMEYGLAIDEAIAVWLEAVQKKGQPLDREVLYQELSSAHRDLGSDWDEDVWRQLPSLKGVDFSDDEFKTILDRAVTARHTKSRELTLNGVYNDAVETLAHLKKSGVRIYMVTEAAADAGMRGLSWLGLAGVIDGVYTYPSRQPPLTCAGTYSRVFPENPDNTGCIKKPHPLLLAAVALDDAKKTKNIPQTVELNDVFDLTYDQNRVLPEFPLSSPLQKDITARLDVKNSPYKETLQQMLGSLLYVGDSKFKDGFLARNAGVTFGFAAYGKKIKAGGEKDFKRSEEILYAVTGWDKDALKLTQEASRSPVVQALQPDFTFENSLAEALDLF
jgi:phosphoglycolate phosphatase-like HAD superfamily hydrolase